MCSAPRPTVAELERANAALHAELAEYRRAEETLHRRYEFGRLVTRVSSLLVNVAPEGVDAAILQALQEIASFDQVQRVYLARFVAERDCFTTTHEWEAPGFPSFIAEFQNAPFTVFPWSNRRLLDNQPLVVRSTADFPPEAEAEKRFCARANIESLLTVPTMFRGQVCGYVGFNSATPRDWSEESVSLLRLVGEIFAGALLRREHEQTLRESEENYRTLVESAQEAITTIDAAGRFLIMNGTAARALGGRPRDFVGKHMSELFPPPDAARQLAAVQRVIASGAGHTVERPTRLPSGERWFRTSLQPLRNKTGETHAVLMLARDITERKRAEENALLQRDLAVVLAAVDDLQQGIELCLDAALQATGLDCGGIYLCDPPGDRLRLAAARNISSAFARSLASYPMANLAAETRQQGRPTYRSFVPGGSPDFQEATQAEGLRCVAELPILHEGRLVATLHAASHVWDEVPLPSRPVLEAIGAQMGGVIARLRARDALRESETLLRALLDASPDPVGLKDAGGRWLIVNAALARLVGLPASAVLGRTTQELDDGHPTRHELAHVAEETDPAAWAAGAPHKYESSVPVPGGAFEAHEVVKVPLYQADGSRRGLLLVAHDVSAWKQAEQQLLIQRDLATELAAVDQLQKGLELCLDAGLRASGLDCGDIYVRDESGKKLVLVAARNLTADFLRQVPSLPLDEPPSAEVFAGPARYRGSRDAILTPYAEPVRREGLKSIALVPIRHGGEVLACLHLCSHTWGEIPVVCRPVLEAIGAQMGGVIARLRTEESRLVAERLAERRQRLALIGELAAGVAHQFRNPLHGLLYAMDLLEQRGGGDAEVRRLVDVVRNGLHRMDHISAGLLRLGRDETGLVAPAPVEEIFDSALLLVRARAEAEGIELRTRIEPGLPELVVDAGRFPEAILNLLTNALDASQRGDAITLEARRVPGEAGGIEILVCDTGAGIAPEHRDKLFLPFFTTKGAGEGSGLGLPIVKAIVEKHGGTLELVDQAGPGACFRIHLPAPAAGGKIQGGSESGFAGPGQTKDEG